VAIELLAGSVGLKLKLAQTYPFECLRKRGHFQHLVTFKSVHTPLIFVATHFRLVRN